MLSAIHRLTRYRQFCNVVILLVSTGCTFSSFLALEHPWYLKAIGVWSILTALSGFSILKREWDREEPFEEKIQRRTIRQVEDS